MSIQRVLPMIVWIAVTNSFATSSVGYEGLRSVNSQPSSHGDHFCGYRPPKLREILPSIALGEAKPRRVRRHEAQPLRIRYFYHNESISKLSAVQFDLIDKTILPAAMEYWKANLRPRYPLTVPIKLNRRCRQDKVFFVSGEKNEYCREFCEEISTCGDVPVPPEHLAPCRACDSKGNKCHTQNDPEAKGVPDADFVLYVSAIQGEKCTQGETIAYAVHCQQESEFDRPIAGHANLCPSTLIAEEQHIKTLLSTVKHEILHALGFSVSLFAYFRDDDGRPLTERSPLTGRPDIDEPLMVHRWNDKIIRTLNQTWLTTTGPVIKQRHYVVTPRVVAAVREHFGCDDLIGAELEDQGDDGTRLTHWEKRLFENEAMTGTNTQNPVYSRITFALMEDTGWYWSTSGHDELLWGRRLGCNFTRMSCFEWMRWKRQTGHSIYPYCDTVKRTPLRTTCTDTRNAVALCNLIQYDEVLPEEFRHFDQIDNIGGDHAARFGSSVSLADYCPFVQEFTWANSGRSSDCSYALNQPDKNFALEIYGNQSACFHTDRWKERSCEHIRHWHNWGSACYQYECRKGMISVTLSTGTTLTCLYGGQKLHVKVIDDEGWQHTSHIVCPACEELCSQEECSLATINDTENVIEIDSSANQNLQCGDSVIAPVGWLVTMSSVLVLSVIVI